MESGLCFATRLRVDLPERLPSLSEYLLEDLPTPQLRVDDEGNLIVQLEKDCPSQTNHFLSGYGSSFEPERIYERETASRTWTFQETQPAYPISISAGSNVTQSNCFRSESDSFDFPTIDALPVSWEPFSTQIDSFGFASSASSSSTSLPQFPSVDVMPSSQISHDVSTASLSNINCAVTWSKPSETLMHRERPSGVTSTSSGVTSSRKRATDPTECHLEDVDARKLELKRAKNREAAQRCQQRKQERIVRLESKVGRLREQNVALGHTVTGLREQIVWLQRQIVTHANNGCNIAPQRLTTSR